MSSDTSSLSGNRISADMPNSYENSSVTKCPQMAQRNILRSAFCKSIYPQIVLTASSNSSYYILRLTLDHKVCPQTRLHSEDIDNFYLQCQTTEKAQLWPWTQTNKSIVTIRFYNKTWPQIRLQFKTDVIIQMVRS